MVLRAGEAVETGATAGTLTAPRAAYTRTLVAADPATWTPRRSTAREAEPVVRAEGLAVERGGRAVFRGVDLAVRPGAVIGVTGPSGCGKSSLGDALLGLVPAADGRVHRREGLGARALRKLYQDPVAAFARRRTLGRSIDDVARLVGTEGGRVDALLERLGLDPVLLERLPGAVSGGELQRLSLLRALLERPAFLFADEPTSRLDPITQAGVAGAARGDRRARRRGDPPGQPRRCAGAQRRGRDARARGRGVARVRSGRECSPGSDASTG